ncbi:MAG: glucose-6-phosphate isomerase [Deltaproteobacteria bacterium]|nr:MAG: glucose-6-phosphate isomerase [Deltaproteobacteria bacterium]
MALIEYRFDNLRHDRIGSRGIDLQSLDRRSMEQAIAELRALASQKDITFPRLPEAPVEPIIARAAADRKDFSDLLVIGIGGSSLGARALLSSCTPGNPGCRVHVLENVDAHEFERIWSGLDPERTCVNVISKSGGTVETMANFLTVRQRLLDRFGVQGVRDRVRVTTDPESGILRAFAQEEGLVTLDVPPGVGGRFSVLSAVGLYPLAMAGLDVEALLAGAAAARDAALAPEAESNPAICFAAHQVALHDAGTRGLVFMPYATRLFDTALWFVQLWAESLGKVRRHADGHTENVGPTPIAALGANDQHSQLQLFMEGPADKCVLLLDVEERRDLRVPAVPAVLAGLQHLEGQSLDDIRAAELRGVRAALTEAGRPNATLSLKDTGARSMGALLMFLQCATGLAGSLLGVSSYDQPGVELAKRFAHGLLGHSDHAHLRAAADRAGQGKALTSVH